MKKIIVALLISGLLWGCSRKPKGSFSISVELSHVPIQATAYLDQMEMTGTRVIDTARILDASGRFTLRGMVPEEGLYRLRFNDSTMLVLVLNGGKVTIRGDYRDLSGASVSGSASTLELNSLLHTLSEKSLAMRSLGLQYDSLKSAGISDSVLMPQAEQLQNLEAAFGTYVIGFADTTHSPGCAVFALSLLQSQDDLGAAQPVFARLSSRFPKSQLVHDMVAQYKQMMGDNTPSLAIGALAPDISLPDPQGKILTLSHFQGKYVLVDFWASWCGPCRLENPNVVKAYQEFRKRNFTIFSVSLDSNKGNWIKAIKKDGLNWNHVSDLKGWESVPAAAYGVEAIPANFLLDPQGRILAENLRGPDLENKLRQVLK